MIRRLEQIAILVLWFGLKGNPAMGQATPATILEVDVENVVAYQADVSDPKKLATNPNVTPVDGPIRNFKAGVVLGDIVSVNSQPATGSYVSGVVQISTTPAPNPGQAIADTAHTSIRSQTLEILKSDGTPVGTIMCLGLDSGPAPPGAFNALYQSAVLPSDQTKGNYAIVGGTGAFFGVRGQLVQRAQALEANPPRLASMAEDPANRRINGGGRIQFFLRVLPMFVPEVLTTPSGPAVTHSNDFSRVSASRPAAAGEILSLFAAGLGPTVPGVDPGQAFPASPLAVVNSPVEVKVNGKSAEVLAAAGFPGSLDGYQVNFRVPPETAKGTAAVQVSAAWIASAPVSIAVQ
ncbi:MAG TPA: hypothetical protein VEV17_22025 [Bryobacteraceae bacterium]|nr:hypothetical protein [Bryobacteraceae bacterium]